MRDLNLPCSQSILTEVTDKLMNSEDKWKNTASVGTETSLDHESSKVWKCNIEKEAIEKLVKNKKFILKSISNMLKKPYSLSPKCPVCGVKKILTDQNTGELFCGKCGLVISDKITDTSAEWRSFQKEGGADPTRTGAPTSLTMHVR